VTYPSDPLRESASFSGGDIYFTQKDYPRRAGGVEALIDAVPRGERVSEPPPEDRSVPARAWATWAGPGETWERIVKDYPASVAARQARVLLRN